MTTSSNSESSSDPPPLSVEETQRILAAIAPVLSEQRLVLIGGQAVALWRSQLASYLPEDEYLAASRDIDFQASQAAVGAIADLLQGTWRAPGHDSQEALSGVVQFSDNDGYPREIDFLHTPYGMHAGSVRHNAQPIDVQAPGGARTRLYVMHPLDVLFSRVANSALPAKQTQLAHDQIAAAIALVPAYGRHLLDLGGRPGDVVAQNKGVMSIATQKNHRSSRVYFEHGLDIADAVLRDERLPVEHLDTELPALAAELQQHRARYRQPPEPGRKLTPLDGERSYYERFRGQQRGSGGPSR
jgi:hypothetical protein